MNNHDGWGFLYFWLLFSLVALNGTAISRILAFSLPTVDVAQTLGPAALLIVILTTGYSPQYLELPTWLRWLSWVSPCAYCYEALIVNEVYHRFVGEISGVVFADRELNIPRIPYMEAPPGMNSEGALMSFDLYILIALTLVFEGECRLAWSFSIFVSVTTIVLIILYCLKSWVPFSFITRKNGTDRQPKGIKLRLV